MAFVTGSPVWLAPGETHYWWYTFNDNRGVQTACANPHTPDSQLVAFDQAQKKAANGVVTYSVSIRNNGPQWAFYNLQGGGVV